MTATHPTTTAATAPCPQCARLARRLDHVEAELAVISWTLKTLAERHGQPRLAAMVAALDTFAPEAPEESEDDAGGAGPD